MLLHFLIILSYSGASDGTNEGARFVICGEGATEGTMLGTEASRYIAGVIARGPSVVKDGVVYDQVPYGGFIVSGVNYEWDGDVLYRAVDGKYFAYQDALFCRMLTAYKRNVGRPTPDAERAIAQFLEDEVIQTTRSPRWHLLAAVAAVLVLLVLLVKWWYRN